MIGSTPRGEWIPACNRTEKPERTRTGRLLLYVFNTHTGRHAWLDCKTDLILTDEEAFAALDSGAAGKAA